MCRQLKPWEAGTGVRERHTYSPYTPSLRPQVLPITLEPLPNLIKLLVFTDVILQIVCLQLQEGPQITYVGSFYKQLEFNVRKIDMPYTHVYLRVQTPCQQGHLSMSAHVLSKECFAALVP